MLKLYRCLVDENNRDQLLASCKTQRVEVFTRRKGHTNIEKTWWYGISSLSTPRQYSGTDMLHLGAKAQS